METKIEFPAYNLYVKTGGEWNLYKGCPIMQKTLHELRDMARAILKCRDVYNEAVRIYGIFNKQQSFIEEIYREDS